MTSNSKICFYPDIRNDGIGRYISEINKYLNNDRVKSKFHFLSPFQFLFETIENYDLVHVPNFFVPIRKKSKIVCTIQDIIPLLDKSLFRIDQRVYLQSRINWSLNNSDHIIFTSQSTCNDVKRIFNLKSEYSIIPLGVSQPIKSTKKINNICNDYFLHVGRRRSHKNILNILEAFSNLNNHKLQMIFTGNKDKDDDDIFQFAKKRGINKQISFVGNVSDIELASLYQHAISLVFPSLYEGFGLPILEAMSYGCPVITSNRSSMQEISSDNALLVDPTNISELQNAMSTMYLNHNLRNTFIESGLKHVQGYQWSVTAKKTQDVYDYVLRNKK